MNVLIGPNGVGKSTVLQAIDALRGFLKLSIEEHFAAKGWDYRDLPNLKQRRKTITWEVRFELPPEREGDEPAQFDYVVSISPRRFIGIGRETLKVTVNGNERLLLERTGRQMRLFNEQSRQWESAALVAFPTSVMAVLDKHRDRQRYASLLRLRRWIAGMESFLFWHPKQLRRPSRGIATRLGPSGENLASLMAWLERRQPESFQKLIDRMKRYFPLLTALSTKGDKFGWRRLLVSEGRGDGVQYSANQIADGFLRILAVTTFLYDPDPPTLVTFEEPENGVHPQLLRDIVGTLRLLTQRKAPRKTQVFVTTHSPYLLDELRDHPDEVYIMEKKPDELSPRIARLTDLDIDLAKQVYSQSLGELWYSGLLGGVPR